MKKLLLPLFFLTGLLIGINAQDDQKAAANKLIGYATTDTLQGWKYSGLVGITFGQTSLTNWYAGGDNTVSGNFLLNGQLNYLRDRWSWSNMLALEYGMIYSSSNDWRKSSDRISFTSIGGYQINSKWSYAALLDFKTQFAKGYDYSESDVDYISTFMAPAYANLALGVTYKPNANYTLFLSPLTERATFVLDDYLSDKGKFGVNPGDKVLWQTGAYFVGSTTQKLASNIDLISTLNMFTPYDDNFGNVDIDWNLLINFQLYKFLSANLNTTLRYYDSEVSKIQFKEIFGLGITYNF